MPKPIVIGWKIHYSDGSTFSSKQGEWKDAPSSEVQIVSVYYSNDFILRIEGFENYFRVATSEGIVISGEYYENALGIPNPPVEMKKHGTLMETSAFRRLRERIHREDRGEFL